MLRVVLFTLCLLLVGGAGLGRTAFAQSAGTGAGNPERLIEIINSARKEWGLTPLRFEPRLTQIAEQMTQSIYLGQNMDAVADGLETLLREKGYPNMLFGGRYATVDGGVDPMIRTWLEEGGRQSILVNPNATEIGAAHKDSTGSPVADMPRNIWAVVIADPARPAAEDWPNRILLLVNSFRARYGLPGLKANAFLDRAAMMQARDMVTRDFFSHINPDGEGPGERATRAGYKFQRLLENIAVGQRSPRDVVDAWIRSKDGHREAMLDPAVTELGIGYVFAPYDNGRIKGLHYWAMSLGRPLE